MNPRLAIGLGLSMMGCRGPICDSCVPSSVLSLQVLPDVANVVVKATGPACAGQTPRLEGNTFTVTITGGGVCQIAVLFPDGKQHTFDYEVTDAREDDCCHAFTVSGGGPSQCARVADAGIAGNHACALF